jgi:hypothetical protein
LYGGAGGSVGDMNSAPRFLNAYYADNEDRHSYQRGENGSNGGKTRPPAHFAVVLGVLCIGGFLVCSIGFEGCGHPLYLFGGWIISAAAGGALVWWWV